MPQISFLSPPRSLSTYLRYGSSRPPWSATDTSWATHSSLAGLNLFGACLMPYQGLLLSSLQLRSEALTILLFVSLSCAYSFSESIDVMVIPLDYRAVQKHYDAQREYDKRYAHIPNNWKPPRPQVGGLLYYPNNVVCGPNGEIIEYPNYVGDSHETETDANNDKRGDDAIKKHLSSLVEQPPVPARVRRYSYERPEELAKLKPPTCKTRPETRFKDGKTLVVVGFGSGKASMGDIDPRDGCVRAEACGVGRGRM